VSYAIDLPKGTHIVCQKGHRVCDVIEEISLGTYDWTEKLGNFADGKNPIGDPHPKCPTCGTQWWPFTPDSFIFPKGRKP